MSGSSQLFRPGDDTPQPWVLPANAIIVHAVLSAGVSLFFGLGLVFGDAEHRDPEAAFFGPAIIVLAVWGLVAAFVAFVGGLAMLRDGSAARGRAAAIATILSPLCCCVPSLAVGIWAFEAIRRTPPPVEDPEHVF